MRTAVYSMYVSVMMNTCCSGIMLSGITVYPGGIVLGLNGVTRGCGFCEGVHAGYGNRDGSLFEYCRLPGDPSPAWPEALFAPVICVGESWVVEGEIDELRGPVIYRACG